VGQSRKSAASPSGSPESGSNPHTSSHGLAGAELTRLPLNALTSNQKGNCNANWRGNPNHRTHSRNDRTLAKRSETYFLESGFFSAAIFLKARSSAFESS